MRPIGWMSGAAAWAVVALAACGPAPDAGSEGPEGVPRLLGEVGRVVEARETAGGSARVSGATVTSGGEIVVTDAGADEVRILGPDGTMLHRLSRGGGDSLRLSRPCCPAIGPDGRVWIRDAGNARYVAFRLTGEGPGDWAAVPMAHDDSEIEAPITFDPERRLIDVGRQVDEETGRETIVRFHLGPEGSVRAREEIPSPPADSLGVHRVDGGLARAWVHPPFGPVHLVGHSPAGGWAEALSSRYAVRWHRPGEPPAELGRDGVRGPPVVEEERRLAAERLRSMLGSIGEADTALPLPERKPPLDELVFDREGRLWVSLLVPAGAPRKADVWGRDGRRRWVAEWPAGVALVRDYVTASRALGIARDASGERLVWVRFAEEPPGTE